MARGHRLNTSIVLAAVHGLSGLFRAVSAVEPSLCRPLPAPLSPSLTSHLASVDVMQNGLPLVLNTAEAAMNDSGAGIFDVISDLQSRKSSLTKPGF